MTDWAAWGTSAGTLALAGATFAAIRSSNRSARIAERGLLPGCARCSSSPAAMTPRRRSSSPTAACSRRAERLAGFDACAVGLAAAATYPQMRPRYIP